MANTVYQKLRNNYSQPLSLEREEGYINNLKDRCLINCGLNDKKNLINGIRDISDAYLNAKRRLNDYEHGIYEYPMNVINDSMKIASHIETVIDSMDEKAKFILENEIINRKKGSWYLDYCSATTYYKIRNDVYREFLTKLEK